MGVEYITGALIVVCLVGIFMATRMKIEPDQHPSQPKTDSGPKPSTKKKPPIKRICSSDWDGDGST